MSRGLIESTLNMKMDVYEAKTGTVLYLLDNKKYYCKSAISFTFKRHHKKVIFIQ